MYAKMRPKDAARIFDKLDLDTLARFTERIKPRQMSKILAGMDPVVAQRLTSEITTRSTTPTPGIDTLPKIEGTPDQ